MTTPNGLEPTQTRRPWRATIRTALAVGIPAILLLPTIVQMVIEELGPNLPPSLTAWLVGAGAFLTAFAALITRILALPQVELLLRRLPGAAFAAQPTPKPTPRDEGGQLTRGVACDVSLVLLGLFAIIVTALAATHQIGL